MIVSNMSDLHIGLDLDNTIIDYDEAFIGVGAELGFWPSGIDLRNKENIKAYLRKGTHGDQDWMRLQGQVYGRYIERAQLCSGVLAFLSAVRKRGHRISIISHKTRYGHFDMTRVSLWDAALGWLEKRGFFVEQQFGIHRNDIHFLETREAKIAKIAEIDCDVFIDDLPEVLLHPLFPAQTMRIWFARNEAATQGCGLAPYPNWNSITNAILDLSHGQGIFPSMTGPSKLDER
jgi:hypothetical protein